jgi:hypothetical protein
MGRFAAQGGRTLATTHLSIDRTRLGADRPWLALMAAVTVVELAWWSASRAAGLAPLPWLLISLAMAHAGLAAALAVRAVLRRPIDFAAWPAALVGATLVGIGASLFLPLKYAIPGTIPFWLDVPLAAAELRLFGAEPWRSLDQALGWATVPLDRIYGLWLPLQSLFLFVVMLERPSPAKTRALIAYTLAWFLLGVVAALLLSSAGPIFHHRLFGGPEFAALVDTLQRRGATMALTESGLMWSAMASHNPGIVAGISAAPSLHVAISLWIYLTVRTIAPRAAATALAYALLIWLASVQLGWHYVSDGLIGVIGMLAIWALAGAVQRMIDSLSSSPT